MLGLRVVVQNLRVESGTVVRNLHHVRFAGFIGLDRDHAAIDAGGTDPVFHGVFHDRLHGKRRDAEILVLDVEHVSDAVAEAFLLHIGGVPDEIQLAADRHAVALVHQIRAAAQIPGKLVHRVRRLFRRLADEMLDHRQAVEHEMGLDLVVKEANALLRLLALLFGVGLHVVDLKRNKERQCREHERQIGERDAVAEGLDDDRHDGEDEVGERGDLLEGAQIVQIFEHDAEGDHDADKRDDAGQHAELEAKVGVAVVKGVDVFVKQVDRKRDTADDEQRPFHVFPVDSLDAGAFFDDVGQILRHQRHGEKAEEKRRKVGDAHDIKAGLARVAAVEPRQRVADHQHDGVEHEGDQPKGAFFVKIPADPDDDGGDQAEKRAPDLD